MSSLLAAVEEVKRERVRGASWSMARLARAIIEEDDSGHISCNDAHKIMEIIVSANRTMAPLHNLATLLGEGCMRGERMGDVARRVLWYMDEARKKLYSNWGHVVPDRSRVLTLSYSSAVELVLAPSRPSMVYVAESLPGGEGVDLARSLRRMGKPVSLIPDTGIPQAVRDSDVVLVGADAVTLDPCLVNKIGSLSAVLAASRFGKPLVAVFESYKIHPRIGCGEVEVEARLYRVDGWGDVVYRAFDIVDGDLVAGAVTEYGFTEFSRPGLEGLVYKFYESILGV